MQTVLAHYLFFFASLVLLNDVLSAVNRLSLVFQCSSIDLTIVSPLLNSTVASLESLQRESATFFEGKVRQLIDKTTTEVDSLRCNAGSAQSDSDEEENESQFELVKIQANEPEKYDKSVHQTFLTEVIKNLRDRFPQVCFRGIQCFRPTMITGARFTCYRKDRGLA